MEGGCVEKCWGMAEVLHQGRKQRTGPEQGHQALRQETTVPVHLCVHHRVMLQPVLGGKACVFYPDQTGLSPYGLKTKTFPTLDYKMDFLSPFHSDNQMKNTFTSDLASSAL